MPNVRTQPKGDSQPLPKLLYPPLQKTSLLSTKAIGVTAISILMSPLATQHRKHALHCTQKATENSPL